MADSAAFEKLRQELASEGDDRLMQHVAQVRELTESAAILQEEVDSLRIFKARTEQENRAKEWQASSATATLPSQIASGLKAQMAHRVLHLPESEA